MVRDDLIEALSARFPMIPDAVIVALTSDAIDWLEQAGDVATVSPVREPVAIRGCQL
jgi:hypothetical protein